MTPLRQRMTEDMQVRNLSPHTQACYVQQVSLFARHFNQSPETLGREQIRAYQVYLTNEKRLAPGSILIAVAALLQDLLPAEALALPRRYPWPAHHPERRGARVPGGASTLPHRQTDNASFFEARLRGTSAGAGHRCAHHPTAAGASEPSHHGSLPAHCHQQGLRHSQSL